MRSIDKRHLKKVFDQLEVQEPSTHFEQRIYQDWKKVVVNTEKPIYRLSEVLALAKLHHKLVIFTVIVAISASVLLGQHLLGSQDEDLHRIDALSELSLSTI